MSVAQQIRALYRNVDGYLIPHGEEASIRASGGDPMYGELTPGGVNKLIRSLHLGARDVFYDLGSGTGKVVLQVAMTAPVRRCVGYELSESRTREARRLLRQARVSYPLMARRCVFYSRDILKAPIDDATVVYCCATAFSDQFMDKLVARLRRLPRVVTFVSLRVLDDYPGVEPTGELSVVTTWDRSCPAYVYRVSPSRRAL